MEFVVSSLCHRYSAVVFLESLRELWESDWKPVSTPSFLMSIAFYALFILYALRAHGAFLFIDNVNLIVHEGGHALFSWLGQTPMLWGGTVLQWMVPLLLAIYYYTQRQAVAFVFCLFFFFENWLYTATYMADARAQVLPLVTIGDPDAGGHDWFLIFSSLGLLAQDTRIASITRAGGWLGMLGTSAFLVHRYLEDRKEAA